MGRLFGGEDARGRDGQGRLLLSRLFGGEVFRILQDLVAELLSRLFGGEELMADLDNL